MQILLNSILSAVSTLPEYAIALIVIETIAVIGLGILIVMDMVGDRIKRLGKKDNKEVSESDEIALARQKAEYVERELAARLAVIELAERENALRLAKAKEVVESAPTEQEPIAKLEVEETAPLIEPQETAQEEQEPLPSATLDAEEDDDTEEVYSTEIDEDTATVKKIIVKRKSSFEAKLCLATDEIKEYYQELANELLAYKKVKPRMSFACESYRLGKPYLAKMTIRGKTLSLFLSLDPSEYADSKYHFTDMSKKKKYQDLPMLVKIKSGRGLKYAKELIALSAEKMTAEKKAEYIAQPLAKNFEKATTEALIEKGLIKESYFENIYDMNGALISSVKIDKELVI